MSSSTKNEPEEDTYPVPKKDSSSVKDNGDDDSIIPIQNMKEKEDEPTNKDDDDEDDSLSNAFKDRYVDSDFHIVGLATTVQEVGATSVTVTISTYYLSRVWCHAAVSGVLALQDSITSKPGKPADLQSGRHILRG